MEVACLTDVGREREHNEDNVLATQFRFLRGNKRADYSLLIVSDGMGGAAAGEVASTLTIRTASEQIYNQLLNAHQEPSQTYLNLERVLLTAVDAANHAVYVASRESPHYFGMGATVTTALACQGKLFVAQVGDSRCYLMRGNTFRQVTQDHSLVAELLRDGRITEEQARHHPRKNIITRAVGSRMNVKADVFKEKLQPGDALLVCSDGLSGMVTDENLRTCLALGIKRRSGLDAVCREMITIANEAGGLDNISAALLMAEAGDFPAQDIEEVTMVQGSTLSWDEAVALDLEDKSFVKVEVAGP